MAKRITLTINGVEIKCQPDQVREVLNSMAGKPAPIGAVTEAHVESAVLRKAFANINTETPEAFVMEALKASPRKDGLHVVWSGLNDALRSKFADINPENLTKEMKASGLITGYPFRGGYKIFIA